MGVKVNAEMMENRSSEIARGHAATFDITTLTVGAADNLTMSQSTAGNNHGHHTRPVVSAGIFIDGWATAKLTQHENERAIEQTTIFKIGHNGV